MYVRFVVGTESENKYRLTGIFTITESLRAGGALFDYEAPFLEETFHWFNVHLPCPPFSRMRSTREWTSDAVCWFLDRAREPIARMWDLIAILEHHGVPVRLVTTEHPGMIVYRDEFQVVAETPRWF